MQSVFQPPHGDLMLRTYIVIPILRQERYSLPLQLSLATPFEESFARSSDTANKVAIAERFVRRAVDDGWGFGIMVCKGLEYSR
jgi:hypothetical protein